jgi:hypothetical protein
MGDENQELLTDEEKAANAATAENVQAVEASDNALDDLSKKAEAGDDTSVTDGGGDGGSSTGGGDDGDDGTGGDDDAAAVEAARVAEEEATQNEITDEDRAGAPDGLTPPQKDAYARVRVRARKAGAKSAVDLAAANQTIADMKAAAVPDPLKIAETAAAVATKAAADASGQVQAGTIEADVKVFTAVALADRILAGELVEGKDADWATEVIRQAGPFKTGMSSEQQCLKIIENARAGLYGDDGPGIAAQAQAELPLITARVAGVKRETDAATAADAAKVKVHVDAMTAANTEIVTKYPALVPPADGKEQTPEYKFATTWMADNVGTAEKPGPRLAALASPESYKLACDDMMNAFFAQKHHASAAENDRLNRERENHEAPMGGGGEGGGGAGGAGGGGGPAPGSDEALDALGKK